MTDFANLLGTCTNKGVYVANPHDLLELKTVQISVVEKLVTWSEDVAFCDVGRAQTLSFSPPSLRTQKGEEGG